MSSLRFPEEQELQMCPPGAALQACGRGSRSGALSERRRRVEGVAAAEPAPLVDRLLPPSPLAVPMISQCSPPQPLPPHMSFGSQFACCGL